MAVSASVTMSEVVARSAPDAAARFMTPSIPSSISSVFHPAIAMYEKPSPISVAVNLLDSESSIALSDSCCICSAVAPEIASTFDMDDSKSMPT